MSAAADIFRRVFQTQYKWWLYALLLCVAIGVCGVLMRPAQERAKGVLAEAERQEEQGQIYADSLALINSVEAFCTPIGKLYAHNLLAKAYYFLGTYYWGQTGEYNRAAKCYTQADYYMVRNDYWSGKINGQMALLCSQAGADSLACIYFERATDFFTQSEQPIPILSPPDATGNDVEAAMAVRTLSDYLSHSSAFIPWRFGVGLLATLGVLLAVFFLSFYRYTDTRLASKEQQIQAQQTAIQEITQSVNSTRQTELKHNISQLQHLYPAPDKAWNHYEKLKQTLNRPLLFLIDRLEKESLNEKEIYFCILCVLYPEMPLPQIAEHICYAQSAIRSYKLRIAKKLHTSSANLYSTLVQMAISAD